MARNKRSQVAIQERTAKKRKQEDQLLQGGGFTDVGDISDVEDGSMIDTWETEEQDYELRPRSLKGYEEDVVEGLPVKVDGKITRKMRKKNERLKENEKEKEESDDDNESQDENVKNENENENDGEDSEDEVNTEEKIIQLKEEIAELVENLMQDPEEHTRALTRLCKMTTSKNPNTCKFSMLALVSVFNSIIPGYRIRPLTELEKKEKVTREVSRLRHFEQSLVANYKSYLETLERLAKTPNNADTIAVNLGILAMKAVNQLIPNVSHFNFRSHILTILIRRVCKPNLAADPISRDSIIVLEQLLSEDDEGNISLDIIKIFSKTIKTRNYNIDESVINIFLSLDVLQDYDPNTKSDEDAIRLKVKKKDRVHLSKKQRKARKEMKQIEEEMRAAEQAVSAEERERNQAEILKLLLSLYLNILKIASQKLVGTVLEGLAKFGNMANFDLLGDFLDVMKELIQDSIMEDLTPSGLRKILLCIVSAFSLVSNHNQMKFNVDLSKFIDALYAVLPYISLDADIELSYKSLRLTDPLNNEILKPSVNVSTKAELLLKSLDHVFFRSKSGTRERAAAFTKRLYICMEHTPEKTTIALLKFIDKLMNRYPEIGGLYSTEDRIGNGHFHLETDDLSRCNPDAATLWENAILSRHYSSSITKGVRALSNRSRESHK
ncbi:hypothetical protein Kpol_178p2 [Vanderwaltozyma polyspora DSM 70294]|uniref:Nucleolar complex-associated protein 3 n=1 Tax=Vanderwaltozyma polyspora (strain ATCC 22028 / DSM 70294 / BCRC 21397 / CBS 2163 / NBRC 10782 / NRRL Y-8283 / UCD 57-17) TaxID=436907 RepID=A7TTN8_VANPO|nr:uncharacterized protein Kpol_178p2 [Vanderwaltozyma polyspora DSM 70294]EDO14368.1 hypothetical protein Kpol_178p2 [Vanderwaltozyma polyspora DSM 70294]